MAEVRNGKFADVIIRSADRVAVSYLGPTPKPRNSGIQTGRMKWA